MTIINVHQAKTHLSRLLDRVANGEEIVIGKAGRPVAKLTSFDLATSPRKPGLWRGKVNIAKDFDRLPAALHKKVPRSGRMTFLLDTHLLLWWLSDNHGLSTQARDIIEDSAHVLFVSAATAWEISIKRAMGKLKAPQDLSDALSKNHFQSLPIAVSHALLAGQLPAHHEDPFDRMLVAQAQIEGLTLLTHDRRLPCYGHFVKLV